jgi:predicted nucleic acid-binding protein
MARQAVYIDSNLLIALFEANLPDAESLTRAFAVLTGSHTVVTSELTLSEVLVAPWRLGDSALADIYLSLFDRPDLIEAIPVTRDVLLQAARLRSASALRLPDAIHVATASIAACSAMVSSDKRLKLPANMERVEAATLPLERWLSRQ